MTHGTTRIFVPVYLVGEFQVRNTASVFGMCRDTLAGDLLYYPDGRIPVTSVYHDGSFLADVQNSSRIFSSLKATGALPSDAKLSVTIVAPLAAAGNTVPTLAALAGSLAELGSTSALSLTDLLVQIKVPFADIAEALEAGDDEDELLSSLRTTVCGLIDAVPTAAGVSLHFNCRDGANFKIHPHHLELIVDLANDFMGQSGRYIQLLHIPVPLIVPDEAFFAPLERLSLPDGCLLCLGLVHLSDGVEGAMRRIRLARRYASGFAIAARSGFAAREASSVPEFLKLHAQVADAYENSLN